jgi:hypothetical protein
LRAELGHDGIAGAEFGGGLGELAVHGVLVCYWSGSDTDMAAFVRS